MTSPDAAKTAKKTAKKTAPAEPTETVVGKAFAHDSAALHV